MSATVDVSSTVFVMTHSEGPKPAPHLYQPPTLAELAELHARRASAALMESGPEVAEAHAAVARACAHAAIANRPPLLHYRNGASR